MQVTRFEIEGVLLLEPKTFADERGFFCERFKLKDFHEAGLRATFVQDNFSTSKPGVLRGLHYQWDLPQGKLVTCTSGRILDVAVDIRAKSPSFGKHIAVELAAEKPQWLWVPAGFAHGFCVLGDTEAHVLYKVDQYYNSKGESGILWNDSELAIEWPRTRTLNISEKDLKQKSFSDYGKAPIF